MSETKNCHYISWFLTKPWEVEQRQLVYYDFDTGQIERAASRNLFAGHRLNTQATEDLLNRIVETPLGRLRTAFKVGRIELTPSEYRAALPLILLQGPRTLAAIAPSHDDVKLGEFLAWPVEQIDAFVATWMADKKLLAYRVHRIDRLCMPSTGIFTLPVIDPKAPGGIGFEPAIPFDERTFLAIIPKSASFDEFDEMAEGKQYGAMSVGLDAKRVVVPPGLMHHGDEKLKERIIFGRTNTIATVRSLKDLATMTKIARITGGPTNVGEQLKRAREKNRAQAGGQR